MANLTCEPGMSCKLWPLTIDLLKLHQHHRARYPYLLASTSRSSTNQRQDRYDILFGFPQHSLELWPSGLESDALPMRGESFLSALDELWNRERKEKSSLCSDLPFNGGWFLYLAYELAEEIEPSLKLYKQADSAIPIAMASRIPVAVINDRLQQQSWLVIEEGYEHLFEELKQDIEASQQSEMEQLVIDIQMQEDEPDVYLQNVQKVKDYIREGDVFQVNLSRQWQGNKPADLTADQLFSKLSQTNPAPFAGLVQFEKGAVISSSPERLVKTHHNIIETRPIAGTRPRGHDEQTDELNLQELIGHPKERAEHVMLIDLERNDLGRVCAPGSVKVNELMVLESYAHVHHIVSNVQGKLKDNTSPADVIRAVFPGGTITGCPKVRCMEILAELEQATRGAYTGAIGYLNHSGDMDLNILIRSIVMDKETIRFRAGAGLVADSIAENELQETRAKARGMLLSLQGNLP